MSANGQNRKPVKGVDVSIVKLIPRNERKIAKKYRQRIEASVRAIGLIEPLIVFPLGEGFEILDGVLRYQHGQRHLSSTQEPGPQQHDPVDTKS